MKRVLMKPNIRSIPMLASGTLNLGQLSYKSLSVGFIVTLERCQCVSANLLPLKYKP